MSWTGSNTKFAIAKGSVWGTAVTAFAAGKQVYVTSEDLTPDAKLIPSESLTGTPFPSKGDKGDELHSGNVSLEWDFDTIHRMLAYAMGTAGAPSAVGAGTFLHTIRMANSLEGLFATIAFSDGVTFVREYPSATGNGFTMGCQHNERVKGTVGFVPNALNINTTSGANEFTNFPSLTLPTGADTAYPNFNQLDVYLTASGAPDFVPGTDDLYVSGVSFTMPSAFKTDDVTTRYAPYIDEPLREGDVVPTGTLTISKLQSTQGLIELLSKDTLKMKWVFTGPIADGSEPYFIEFWFSNVQIATGNFNVPGKGYVPKVLNFQCAKPTAAHTGFAFADAFYARVQNVQSADALV